VTQPPDDTPPSGGYPQPGMPPEPPQYGGQPQYGEPQYGAPQYGGQPTAGQPQYGQPQYGGQPPGYGSGYQGPAYKGQELGLPPNGPNALSSQWKRLGARIIDAILISVIPAVILAAIMLDDDTDFTVGTTELTGDLIALSLVLVALSAIYEIGMLVTRGATAGKLALGMRVARIADGQKPQLSDAAIRWAVPAVAGLIPRVGSLFQLLDGAWCLWDPNRQCLHDKAAKTVVVDTK